MPSNLRANQLAAFAAHDAAKAGVGGLAELLGWDGEQVVDFASTMSAAYVSELARVVKKAADEGCSETETRERVIADLAASLIVSMHIAALIAERNVDG